MEPILENSAAIGSPAHVENVLSEVRASYQSLPEHLRKPIRSMTPEERREYNRIKRDQRKNISRGPEKTAPVEPEQLLIDETAAQSIAAVISPVLDFVKQGLGFSDTEIQTFGKAWQPFLNRLANTIGASGETSLAVVWLAGYVSVRIPLFIGEKKNVSGNNGRAGKREVDLRENVVAAENFALGDYRSERGV